MLLKSIRQQAICILKNMQMLLADGSYVRDTAYDETLPQPTIVPPAVETPDPNVSSSPETQVVSEWIATEADINKPAGTEFMPGLVGMIPFGRPMQDIAVFDDGFISNFAITDKKYRRRI